MGLLNWLKVHSGYSDWRSASRRCSSAKNAVSERRAFLSFAVRSGLFLTGTAIIPATIWRLTSSSVDSKPKSTIIPSSSINPSINHKIESLVEFFSRRKHLMVNYIDSNLDPVLWAEAAVRSNWTAAQLRLVEKVAAKLFQSHPEVSPEIRFVVQRLDYRPFIATGSVPNLSAIPRIGLLINYRAAQLSEHEWENMLKHELNHAKARRTTDFVSPKVLPNPNDKNQYRRNAFHVFRSLFTDQENVTLDKIAPNINMLKEHLAIIIDEVLADALIPPDPITPIRYQKVINQLILSNDTLGEEWIGRVKAIADIFGVKIDMETANAKAIGNPKAREAGYKLAKLAWALKDRLVFKYDPSSNTFTIER